MCHLHIVKSFALYLELLFPLCFDLILFGCQGPLLSEHKAVHLVDVPVLHLEIYLYLSQKSINFNLACHIFCIICAQEIK